jgi:hypothetical protein
LERPSDAFSYTSFRGSFFKPQLHLSFETAGESFRLKDARRRSTGKKTSENATKPPENDESNPTD